MKQYLKKLKYYSWIEGCNNILRYLSIAFVYISIIDFIYIPVTLNAQQKKLGEQGFSKNVAVPRDPRISTAEKKSIIDVPPVFVWSKEIEILRDWADDEQQCQERYDKDNRWLRIRRRKLIDGRYSRVGDYNKYVQRINKRIDDANEYLILLWNSTLERIKELKIQCNLKDEQLREEILKKMAEESKAVQDKEDELAELRAGFFCSKCKRSKSQIEKTGVNFYQHVQDVKGRVEPLPSEEIQKKEDEWNAKIERIRESYCPVLITQRLKGQENCRKSQRELERLIEVARWKNVDEVNEINKELFDYRKRFDMFMDDWNESWNEYVQFADRIEQMAQSCLNRAAYKRDKRLYDYREQKGD